jgi:type II secretory pathway component PulL
MENQTLLLILIVALPLMILTALVLAMTLTGFDDRRQQKTLDAIAAKYAARKLADDKHHSEFRAKINAMTKDSDAKLLAMKNCPKWEKLTHEINSEHAAMITGRNQFNAMMNR